MTEMTKFDGVLRKFERVTVMLCQIMLIIVHFYKNCPKQHHLIVSLPKQQQLKGMFHMGCFSILQT